MEQKQKKTFLEFMSEEKALSRWIVLRIGLMGVLAGVTLGIVWSQLAWFG